MNIKKEKHPLPTTYSDYLRKAERKDPDTYKGYHKLVVGSNGKLKYLRHILDFHKKPNT